MIASKKNGTVKRAAVAINPRYHDGLVEFKKRCTDYDSIETFLAESFRDDVGGLRTFVQSTKGEMQAIDIGYGNGVVTSRLAALLMQNSRVPVKMELLELTDEYVEVTRERLNRFVSRGLGFHFIQQKAENYFGPSTNERYDLVFASHALLFISLECISAIASSVRAGGYMIVIIGARSSIMSYLKDLFVPALAITGKDVLEAMGSLELPFEVTVVSQPSFLDLRDVDWPQNKSELTELVKNLLSLMVQKNVDDIGHADYETARDMIVERSDSNGLLRLENDCLIFRRK